MLRLGRLENAQGKSRWTYFTHTSGEFLRLRVAEWLDKSNIEEKQKRRRNIKEEFLDRRDNVSRVKLEIDDRLKLFDLEWDEYSGWLTIIHKGSGDTARVAIDEINKVIAKEDWPVSWDERAQIELIFDCEQRSINLIRPESEEWWKLHEYLQEQRINSGYYSATTNGTASKNSANTSEKTQPPTSNN